MPKQLAVSAGQAVSVMNDGAPMIETEVARSGHDRSGYKTKKSSTYLGTCSVTVSPAVTTLGQPEISRQVIPEQD